MKPVKTKAQTRAEINQQIDEFLQTGGEVNQVKAGVSGRDPGKNLALPMSFERSQGEATRTQVNEQIAAIEARRKAKVKPPSKSANKKPHKVLLVDDFGEPIRWVWSDE